MSTGEVQTIWSAIRLLLASDDGTIIEPIRRFMVTRRGNLELCSLSVSAFERLLAHHLEPLDLVLVDDSLEGGRRVTDMVRALGPERPGLILLTHPSRWYDRSLWGETDRDLECPFKVGDLMRCLTDVLNERQNQDAGMTSISGLQSDIPPDMGNTGRVIAHDDLAHVSQPRSARRSADQARRPTQDVHAKRTRKTADPSSRDMIKAPDVHPRTTRGKRLAPGPSSRSTRPKASTTPKASTPKASPQAVERVLRKWSSSKASASPIEQPQPTAMRPTAKTSPVRSRTGEGQRLRPKTPKTTPIVREHPTLPLVSKQSAAQGGKPVRARRSAERSVRRSKPPGAHQPSRSRTPNAVAVPASIAGVADAHFARVGTLRRGDLEVLLCQIYEQKLTGALTIRSEEDERQIFFIDGYPVQALSRNDAVPLGELLVSLDMISPDILQHYRVTRLSRGRLGQHLLKQQALTLAQLNQAMHIQIQELILSCFHVTGAYAFQSGRSVPVGLKARQLNPLALIAASIREQADTPTMALSLVEYADQPVVLTERAAAFRSLLDEVLGEGASILDQIDGLQSLNELTKADPEREEWLQEALFLMHRAQLVTFGYASVAARLAPKTDARVKLPSPHTSGAVRTSPFGATPDMSRGRLLPLPEGHVIDRRYTIQERVGVGERVSVYRAMDMEMEELCALKVMVLDRTTTDLFERFKRELSVGRRLVNPHIVRVYNLGADDDMRFLSTEYIEGRSLEALMSRGGAFPLRRGLELLGQL
ncbi:MAG: DUF4388 domain-containing protein, partial [Myxococcota bacterium]